MAYFGRFGWGHPDRHPRVHGGPFQHLLRVVRGLYGMDVQMSRGYMDVQMSRDYMDVQMSRGSYGWMFRCPVAGTPEHLIVLHGNPDI